MKNVKSIIAIFIVFLATSTSVLAAENDKAIKKPENVISEIISILGSEAPFAIDETSKAEITFTVNDENEVIIIQIKTGNVAFRNYAERVLNHKKLDEKLKARTLYKLPVRLKSI